METVKLEKIWWWDPMGLAQWHDQEQIESLEPARCVTIAQIVHETDAHIVTAASWSNSEGAETEYSDITVIPKGCIQARYPLTINTQGETHGLAH